MQRARNALTINWRQERDRLEQLTAGQEDPPALAELARGRLRDKIAESERSLHGQARQVKRSLVKLPEHFGQKFALESGDAV